MAFERFWLVWKNRKKGRLGRAPRKVGARRGEKCHFCRLERISGTGGAEARRGGEPCHQHERCLAHEAGNPQELQSVQGHDVPLVAVCRITPAKSNLAIFEMKKPAVRDGYTVSEVREIFN